MGMEWVRGRVIGSGAFSTVYLATRSSKHDREDRCFLPRTLAVKSCDGCSDDASMKLLKDEHGVLTRLGRHPNIVNCYGRSEGNLLLEYAQLGSLDRAGPIVPEGVLRRYARHLLRALGYVHSRGFVHCDVKPQNILLFPGRGGGMVAKLADFGLAKRVGSKKGGFRGTPFYVSPEAVNDGKCGPSLDVWAVGCVVAEMVSGKRALRMRDGENSWSFMVRIGAGKVVPEAPEELSEEGKDFLSRCWERDPENRWTAEMLLRHPFVADCDGDDDCQAIDDDDERPGASPRCHFEFAELDSFDCWGSESGASTVESGSSSESETTSILSDSALSLGYRDRIQRLPADQMPDWGEETCSWIEVR
ncbi:hypothetical protein MLD38_007707 [Melastoma candidum]|uniref:Uncharacterized protein n=1 Tax=Melastoma candidum TaxID=119954 RepID=A0ACB9RSI4_9MYRT|nr:hypothetical protein MLD38_007707 [Melastoma candidum]